jgi:hypothetical protein
MLQQKYGMIQRSCTVLKAVVATSFGSDVNKVFEDSPPFPGYDVFCFGIAFIIVIVGFYKM